MIRSETIGEPTYVVAVLLFAVTPQGPPTAITAYYRAAGVEAVKCKVV